MRSPVQGPSPFPESRFGRALLVAALLAALPVLLRLTACAGRSPAHADSQEVRLTSDANISFLPRYSPDGEWVAYTVRGTGEKKNSVFVVPARGGNPRQVSPDSLSSALVGWVGGGRDLLVNDSESHVLRRLGLDGRILEVQKWEPFGKAFDVSPDGTKLLVVMFNGDNNDLAVAPVDALEDLQIVQPTGYWEAGGCFGPRPGDVTAVFRVGFQTTACSLAVWSPATRRYTSLALPEARNVEPAWSPDGRYLVYGSDLKGRQDLWLYDSKVGQSLQLTSGPEEAVTPDWSPDGEWLAFARRTRTSHIFRGDPRTFETRQLTEGPARDFAPENSRDGRMVAFARLDAPDRPGARAPGPSLCVIPAAGGKVRRLDLKGLQLSAEAGFSWSPDGREIAFVADDGSGNQDIYRAPAGGGAPARVTVDPGPDVVPFWSPDGRYIAYTRPAQGETQVWVVPSNGGLARQMTFHEGLSQLSVWSPASDRLAYMTIRGEGGFEVRVTSIQDPEESRLVLTSTRPNYPFCWSRDGNAIIMMRADGVPWSVWAVSLTDGREVLLGRDRREPAGESHFLEPTDEGRRHWDVLFPGDVVTFANGDETSQIVAMPVAAFIRASLLARKER